MHCFICVDLPFALYKVGFGPLNRKAGQFSGLLYSGCKVDSSLALFSPAFACKVGFGHPVQGVSSGNWARSSSDTVSSISM